MAKDTRKPETIIRELKKQLSKARADHGYAMRRLNEAERALRTFEREAEFLKKDNQRLEQIAQLARDLAQERDRV